MSNNQQPPGSAPASTYPDPTSNNNDLDPGFIQYVRNRQEIQHDLNQYYHYQYQLLENQGRNQQQNQGIAAGTDGHGQRTGPSTSANQGGYQGAPPDRSSSSVTSQPHDEDNARNHETPPRPERVRNNGAWIPPSTQQPESISQNYPHRIFHQRTASPEFNLVSRITRTFHGRSLPTIPLNQSPRTTRTSHRYHVYAPIPLIQRPRVSGAFHQPSEGVNIALRELHQEREQELHPAHERELLPANERYQFERAHNVTAPAAVRRLAEPMEVEPPMNLEQYRTSAGPASRRNPGVHTHTVTGNNMLPHAASAIMPNNPTISRLRQQYQYADICRPVPSHFPHENASGQYHSSYYTTTIPPNVAHAPVVIQHDHSEILNRIELLLRQMVMTSTSNGEPQSFNRHSTSSHVQPQLQQDHRHHDEQGGEARMADRQPPQSYSSRAPDPLANIEDEDQITEQYDQHSFPPEEIQELEQRNQGVAARAHGQRQRMTPRINSNHEYVEELPYYNPTPAAPISQPRDEDDSGNDEDADPPHSPHQSGSDQSNRRTTGAIQEQPVSGQLNRRTTATFQEPSVVSGRFYRRTTEQFHDSSATGHFYRRTTEQFHDPSASGQSSRRTSDREPSLSGQSNPRTTGASQESNTSSQSSPLIPCAFHPYRTRALSSLTRLRRASNAFKLFTDHERGLRGARTQNQSLQPPAPINQEQRRAPAIEARLPASKRTLGVPPTQTVTANNVPSSSNPNLSSDMHLDHAAVATAHNNSGASQFSLGNNASRPDPYLRTTMNPNGHVGNLNRMEMRHGEISLAVMSTPVLRSQPQVSNNRRLDIQPLPQLLQEQERGLHEPEEQDTRQNQYCTRCGLRRI
ncbi:unnamed protein product [Orchesella dallaii]|uniref:Uncharacterized protein n=1 Tax=Orchesella dallaii TaxID=48710 RepID=A0ABP1QM07_9HEXA